MISREPIEFLLFYHRKTPLFLCTDADSHTEPGDVFPIIAGGYEIRKRAEVSLNHGKILIKSVYKIQIYRDTAKELVKKLRNDIKHTQKK